MRSARLLAPLLLALPAALRAGDPPRPPVALVGARVIDGLADAPHTGWTIVIDGERIAAAGPDAAVPEGAERHDLAGKTVMPGMFDCHGHCFTVDGKTQLDAYPLLDLAAGVTTVFSPGEVDPEAAVAWRDRQAKGEVTGCRLLTAGPYFEHGQGELDWLVGFADVAGALDLLARWQDRIDGIKLQTHLTEDEARAVLEGAHRKGLHVTGHLGSITAKRAAALGIDRLEHGVYAMSELSRWRVASGADWRAKIAELAAIDPDGEEIAAIVAALLEHAVAVSPTTASYEIGLPEWEPVVADWEDYLTPPRRRLAKGVLERQRHQDEGFAAQQRKALALQLAFLRRFHAGGGRIVVGTDPAGLLLTPGFSVHREIELLCRAGLTPMQALLAATSAAADALGVGDRLGRIAAGKLADLVVLADDPSVDPRALRTIEAVWQAGKRHDPAELRAQARGKIR